MAGAIPHLDRCYKIAVIQPTMMHRGGADFIVHKLCAELGRRGHEVTLIVGDRYHFDFWGTPQDYNVYEVMAGEQFYLEVGRWKRVGRKLARVLSEFDIINLHNTPAYFYWYYAKQINKRINGLTIWFCHEPFRFFYREVTDRHSTQCTIYDILTEDVNLFNLKKTIEKMQRYGILYPLFFIKDNVLLPRLMFRKIGIHLFPRFYKDIIRKKVERIVDLDKRIVNEFDCTLCNSAFTADNVQRIYNVPARVCYLGHTNHIDPREITYKKFFLTVSRLDQEKNNIAIVKAVHSLHRKNKLNGYTYVLIGKPGTAADELRRYIKDNHLEKVIDLRGFVSEEEKEALYKSMSFSVYVPYDEPFGLVPFESFSYKKTIITSDHGGPQESVDHMNDGIRVDPDDIEGLERAILYCIENPEKVKEMGEAGYRKQQESYLFSHFVDRFLLEIQRCYEEKHGACYQQ